MLSLLISFVILSVLILACYLGLIWSVIEEKRRVSEKRERLDEIYSGLYREYEKTRGPEWAKNQLSEVVRNIVKGIDPKTTKVYHV